MSPFLLSFPLLPQKSVLAGGMGLQTKRAAFAEVKGSPIGRNFISILRPRLTAVWSELLQQGTTSIFAKFRPLRVRDESFIRPKIFVVFCRTETHILKSRLD